LSTEILCEPEIGMDIYADSVPEIFMVNLKIACVLIVQVAVDAMEME
jgi:hypothetical protein